jgi:uncharacterized protein (TIGR02147 family)
MNPEKFSVFDFIDFRLVLKEYYREHKETRKGFSHRLMANSLGFTSPNFLKLVMDGKRNISRESLGKITHGLDFNKKEAEYFSYLVFFAQAKSSIDKNFYFGLIAAKRARKNIVAVLPDQFEYFGEWYHPMVRELIAGKREPLDYEALSHSTGKKVSASKVRKSVEMLLRLGLIKIDATGRYIFSAPLLNTENELNSFAIRRYHKEILAIAQQALDDIPPQHREMSQVTIKISRTVFAKIKQRLQEFREELLQIATEDADVDTVYHANFQLYPVTRSE